MPTFIVLCTFEESGMAGLAESSAPKSALEPLLEAVGAKLENLWFCVGLYDVVAVVEAETLRSALAFLVAFGSRGGVKTVTLAAEDNWGGVLDDARAAAPTWGGWIDRGGEGVEGWIDRGGGTLR